MANICHGTRHRRLHRVSPPPSASSLATAVCIKSRHRRLHRVSPPPGLVSRCRHRRVLACQRRRSAGQRSRVGALLRAARLTESHERRPADSCAQWAADDLGSAAGGGWAPGRAGPGANRADGFKQRQGRAAMCSRRAACGRAAHRPARDSQRWRSTGLDSGSRRRPPARETGCMRPAWRSGALGLLRNWRGSCHPYVSLRKRCPDQAPRAHGTRTA